MDVVQHSSCDMAKLSRELAEGSKPPLRQIFRAALTHPSCDMAKLAEVLNVSIDLYRVPTKIGKQDSMTDLLLSMTPILTWFQIWL